MRSKVSPFESISKLRFGNLNRFVIRLGEVFETRTILIKTGIKNKQCEFIKSALEAPERA